MQPDGAITGLRIFYSTLPVLGTLLAIYVMRNYDLTEERASEIRVALEKKKQGQIAGGKEAVPVEKGLSVDASY